MVVLSLQVSTRRAEYLLSFFVAAAAAVDFIFTITLLTNEHRFPFSNLEKSIRQIHMYIYVLHCTPGYW